MSEQPSVRPISLRAIFLFVIAAVGLAGALIWGFVTGRDQATAEARSEQTIKPAVDVSRDSTGRSIVTLGPELQEQADIETEPLEATPYQRQIEAYGSILDLQPFTDLSNSIANAKAQFAIAEARLAASRAAFKRAEALHKDNQNISTAQLQAADAAYQSDAASVQAAQVQMQNAAASATQAWGHVLGQSLAEGADLARDLVQHKKVLVQVTLPLGATISQAPPSATIETATGQRVSVDLVSPAPRTDPKIQGVSFYYTADAESGALPGMNVTALLPVGAPAPGFVIPASAVVWSQGHAWVYLQTAANTFTRRDISTGEPQPGGGYVAPAPVSRPEADSDAPDPAQGLPADGRLVVQGAQTLLSQEFNAQIQVGD